MDVNEQKYSRDYQEIVNCLEAMSRTGNCKELSRRNALKSFRDDTPWKSLLIDDRTTNIGKESLGLVNTLDNRRGCRGGNCSKMLSKGRFKVTHG